MSNEPTLTDEEIAILHHLLAHQMWVISKLEKKFRCPQCHVRTGD